MTLSRDSLLSSQNACCWPGCARTSPVSLQLRAQRGLYCGVGGGSVLPYEKRVEVVHLCSCIMRAMAACSSSRLFEEFAKRSTASGLTAPRTPRADPSCSGRLANGFSVRGERGARAVGKFAAGGRGECGSGRSVRLGVLLPVLIIECWLVGGSLYITVRLW